MVTGTSYVATAPTDLAHCWSTCLRTDAVVVVKDLMIQRIAWPPCSALLTSIADRSPYLRNAIVTVSIGLAKSFHAPPTI